MPTYEYLCSACKHAWEDFHAMKDVVEVCPECHEPTAVRQCAAAAINFGPWAYLGGTRPWNSTHKEAPNE